MCISSDTYIKANNLPELVFKMPTDYEQWKSWFDKWNIEYEENPWGLTDSKELVVAGIYCQASVQFDLDGNFHCMTAYE